MEDGEIAAYAMAAFAILLVLAIIAFYRFCRPERTYA